MTDAEIRVQLYREFVRSGRAPLSEALADTLRIPATEMREALERLAAGRAIALQPESREIMFAAPLSAVPTPYLVRADGRQLFAPCIWDALGTIAMLGAAGTVETSCPCCGEAMSVEIRDRRPIEPHGIVHFAAPAKQWWDDIVFT